MSRLKVVVVGMATAVSVVPAVRSELRAPRIRYCPELKQHQLLPAIAARRLPTDQASAPSEMTRSFAPAVALFARAAASPASIAAPQRACRCALPPAFPRMN